MIELTGFTKANGPLTKRISLAPDGTVKSDGSACVMAQGSAHRVHVGDVGDLAGLIEHVQSNQALALGMLRPGLPERVTIVTKRKLASVPDAIARTGNNIMFRRGTLALALLDYDQKDMPAEIAEVIDERGGLWPTLLSVLPALRTVAHVARRSTSAGLFRVDTGVQLPGSGGAHIYVFVRDGSDIGRFLKALHERCWLAGFGWYSIGAGGQLLERSIVDRTVGAPEHLVFEGAPILEPPLAQDRDSRRPVPVDGATLDTLATCPPLDIAEASRLRELKAKAKHPIEPEAAKARREFIVARADALAARTGMSISAAQREIERQCEGVLLPEVALAFDDDDFIGCTVADVLDDPARFEGATLADPLEGIDYGRCVAHIMLRDDGTPWIHSFAHGRTIYQLKHNAASVRAAIDKADEKDAAKILIQMIANADFDIGDEERLRAYVAKRAGIGRRELNRLLKIAARERAAKSKQEKRERRARLRTDPRPQIPRPDEDAEWLPQMGAFNNVIGKSTAPHPASRDIDGRAAKTRKIAVPKTHAFITSEPGDKSK
jgi:hypothetical protein